MYEQWPCQRRRVVQFGTRNQRFRQRFRARQRLRCSAGARGVV